MEETGCQNLLAKAKANNPKADLDTIRLAFDYAKEAHAGQKRASGEPYIAHCLRTAEHLAEMRLPVPIIVTGLLHDVPEDTEKTVDDIRKDFGEDIASMVAGITKLGKIKYRGIDRYVENLRKMFVAMASDIRVILVKFADRMHNLETLGSLPPEKRIRIALESLEIFSPIANRLGMYDIKTKIEDLAFRHAMPKEYEWVSRLAQAAVKVRSGYINRIQHLLRKRLNEANIPFVSVQGRTKHLYSLYRKLLKYDRDIDRIHDLIALRIIVPQVADCYAALGAIHQAWKPMKGRFKDYIAAPKPNSYRSLHTTVFCEDGEVVEFQIRTEEMHEEAERGIAAHWQYDEDGKRASARISDQLSWVRDLSGSAPSGPRISTDGPKIGAKIDIFHSRIFVFTPKGDVIDLPEGATPVDFAYAIHTQMGNTCVGARINDQIVSLDTPLSSGDCCEVTTDRNRKSPNPDWLDFVKTTAAKNRIRSANKSRLSEWLKETAPPGPSGPDTPSAKPAPARSPSAKPTARGKRRR
ncbi:RelA/SpoT family protein [Candidatus Uhrbacteria bacterium]|nr:RelA/SpoT family protein [Candidatus Uhrbacteria bacterium]